MVGDTSVKPSKLFFAAIVVLFLGSLRPDMGWATKIAILVVGEVTATPTPGQIEVNHQVYRVQKSSAADKSLKGVTVGQKVDVVLDGPVDGETTSVLSIKRHIDK
jgi:hypothetical protein